MTENDTPETDDQLIERVINDELAGDSFDLQSEELAYARHLSDRELVDTEANRATWIAARSYYDEELSEEKDKPTIGIDREAEQERAIWELKEIAKDHGDRLAALTFNLHTNRAVELALQLAASNSAGERGESIVAKAEAFYGFLTKDRTETTTEEEKTP